MDDDFTWKLPTGGNSTSNNEVNDGEDEEERMAVRVQYVSGVDTSFLKEDPSVACACLVILHLQTLQVVYQDYFILRLNVPCVPGFLAFREAPALLQLLEKLKNNANHLYPQILMVDGNGLQHPRGFGLACHLGVMANLPTIGIGKNLHLVDVLTQSKIMEFLEAKENMNEDGIALTGDSGFIWGMAIRSNKDMSKPIFISIGHRISLDTAVMIVKMTCMYRVPEPIRQADIRSRDYLQRHQTDWYSCT